LCPPRVRLTDGGTYHTDGAQAKVWRHWLHFWRVAVPEYVDGGPFCVVVNGDALDGRHHGAVSQISQDLADQENIARETMTAAFRALGKAPPLYWVRGTEAHAGASGENEHNLARHFGAVPTEDAAARWELWLHVGKGLAHIAHTIETSSSPQYETTALCREYVDACSESAKWGMARPDWVVRSHRHRHSEVRMPTKGGRGTVIVTPGWQLKTPFVYRTRGGRTLLPQIGGSCIIAGKDEFYTRSYVVEIERGKPEVCNA
jgi:hypothetical protein